VLYLSQLIDFFTQFQLCRLAGKKFGHPAGIKKIKLEKVKRNEPKTMKKMIEKLRNREIAAEWKLELLASRARLHSKNLEQLSETKGQDSMYSFTGATTRFGGATACYRPLWPHSDFWGRVLRSQASLSFGLPSVERFEVSKHRVLESSSEVCMCGVSTQH